MKTAISVPDDVFEEAERLAARLEKGRSQLYTDAVREYLARHDPESVTERLNSVMDDLSPEDDRFVTSVARRVLESVEW